MPVIVHPKSPDRKFLVSTRVPAATRNALKKLADQDNCSSMTRYVRIVLEKHVERKLAKKGGC